MTDAEKIAMVKALCGDPLCTDDLASVYLTLAKDKITARMYPWGAEEDIDIPQKYETLQCELASRLFLKRGAEGEITHTERNTSRQYASATDDDLLRVVIPFAKVM